MQLFYIKRRNWVIPTISVTKRRNCPIPTFCDTSMVTKRRNYPIPTFCENIYNLSIISTKRYYQRPLTTVFKFVKSSFSFDAMLIALVVHALTLHTRWSRSLLNYSDYKTSNLHPGLKVPKLVMIQIFVNT